ncbi:MAG: metallophosphoesterase family protein [Planctomycetia bacterium]
MLSRHRPPTVTVRAWDTWLGGWPAFRPLMVSHLVACHLVAWHLVAPVASTAAIEPDPPTVFRVRPYLQNPAPDAMTIRWFAASGQAGRVLVDGRSLVSEPVLCRELSYQGPEPASLRHFAVPHQHVIRVTGLSPATSYPYEVEQDGETIKAILTTAPPPGGVGKGGGVRLFVYADSKTQPESRDNRSPWPPTTALPGGPRPAWVRDRYLADETTGYRMNLACIASRAAESLRAGNPVLASVVGDLVANGGEQRDWDEFWRHNAGVFGSLASRVPLVATIGDHEMCGGPASTDALADLGGFSGPASLIGSTKFQAYFEHPDNGAADARHRGRYHRVDFGPVTLLSLDVTNVGPDDTAGDTNLRLDRETAPHIPDLAAGSDQLRWFEKELADAADRGAITFVQVHHAPFSSGAHGRAAGPGNDGDEHSGRPLRDILGPLLRRHGVRAVFSGHDEMYEHSLVDGVHYYDVGIGGDDLRMPHEGVVNERQIFSAHDHAPEHWKGDVLEEGGRHYGHLEIDVRATTSADALPGAANQGYTVTITPVHVFPILDPDRPGGIVSWERREYDDVFSFKAAAMQAPLVSDPKPILQEVLR